MYFSTQTNQLRCKRELTELESGKKHMRAKIEIMREKKHFFLFNKQHKYVLFS